MTATAALMGILTVAAGLFASRAVKIFVTIGALVAVSAVSLSRIYLGVHWVTDVVAGALLAAAVVTVGTAALNVLVDDPVPASCRRAPSRSANEVRP